MINFSELRTMLATKFSDAVRSCENMNEKLCGYYGSGNFKVILFFLALALGINIIKLSNFLTDTAADVDAYFTQEITSAFEKPDVPIIEPKEHHHALLPQDKSKSMPNHMVVGVVESAPLAFYDPSSHAYEGIGVRIFEFIASKASIRYTYVPLAIDQAPDALINGTVDVLIGPFKVSHATNYGIASIPYLYTSLAIASNQTQATYLQSLGLLLSSEKFLIPIGTLFILLLLGSTVLMIIEAAATKDLITKKPFHHRFINAFTWSTFAFSTVGMEKPADRTGQGYAILFMIITIFASAGITASMTSSLTLQQMAPIVSTPQDLRRVRVGAVVDSPATKYLEENHIPFSPFPSLTHAIKSTLAGNITAVVADEVSLRYIDTTITKSMATNQKPNTQSGYTPQLALLPISLTRSGYAFVLPPNSPWSLKFNKALQDMLSTNKDIFQAILFRYLGYMPQ